jgi:hypothetical protein
LFINAGIEMRIRPRAKESTSMNRRAELLASRIEEGAAGLAAFAEGLSDAEWGAPRRRPIGGPLARL